MCTIRYTNSDGESVITSIDTLKDLRDLIKEKAVKSTIDVQSVMRIPKHIYEVIAYHNTKIKDSEAGY